MCQRLKASVLVTKEEEEEVEEVVGIAWNIHGSQA
jgi:hypothetical protein